MRAGRRDADPGPAHPQGRAAQQGAAGGRHAAGPSSLDHRAKRSLRFAPGGEAAFAAALAGALGDDAGGSVQRRIGRRLAERRARRWPSCCRARRPDVVVLYGERVLREPAAARARWSAIAERLGLRDRDGGRACSACPPPANGRGLREVGLLPDADGAGASTMAAGGTRGAVALRRRPGRDASGPRGLGAARWRSAGHRPRRVPHRGGARARDRRLPGRVLRREGGHGHAPRRPPAAAAAGDRAPGRDPPGLVGAQPSSPSAWRASSCDLLHGAMVSKQRVRGRPVLRRADARRDRRARRALGRARGRPRLGPQPLGTPARDELRRARRAPTAGCGSGPSARSGRARRSRPPRR